MVHPNLNLARHFHCRLSQGMHRIHRRIPHLDGLPHALS